MAGLDLDAFKSSVMNNNLLRPNLFRIRIFPPQSILNIAGDNSFSLLADELELWGEATVLPSFDIGAHQGMRFGYGSIERRPYVPVYDPWPVTFRVDAGGYVWKLFKNWNNLVVNTKGDFSGSNPSKYELAYKTEYLTDTEISIFTEIETNPINVTMIEAFPYALRPVRLDWADNNSYMKLEVFFAFTDWLSTDDVR